MVHCAMYAYELSRWHRLVLEAQNETKAWLSRWIMRCERRGLILLKPLSPDLCKAILVASQYQGDCPREHTLAIMTDDHPP